MLQIVLSGEIYPREYDRIIHTDKGKPEEIKEEGKKSIYALALRLSAE